MHMHFSTKSEFCTISLESPFNPISLGFFAFLWPMVDSTTPPPTPLENNVTVKLG